MFSYIPGGVLSPAGMQAILEFGMPKRIKVVFVAAQTPLLPTLQVQTLSLLSIPQLNPACSTVTTSTPRVGKETRNAVLRITETCKAFSYRMSSVKDAIRTYSRRFGTGILAHVQFSVVGIKGVLLTIYVTATLTPAAMRHFPTTGK